MTGTDNIQWLPLGTVVTLREANRRVMIIGRLQINPATGSMNDYSACPWPEGLLDTRHFIVFNHTDIETIHQQGALGDDPQEHAWITILNRTRQHQ
jgi:hypothetical protein